MPAKRGEAIHLALRRGLLSVIIFPMANKLYYRDNLAVLRESIADELVRHVTQWLTPAELKMHAVLGKESKHESVGNRGLGEQKRLADDGSRTLFV
jgi:hypothetical protein